MINQKVAWSLFVGGLATFLTSIGEFLSAHNSWAEMGTPKEVGHILIISGSLCVALFGALGANLPREQNSRTDDKGIISQEHLNRLNERDNNEQE